MELVSPGNNQGLLVPKLTTRPANSSFFISTLTASENGLLIFDSDDPILLLAGQSMAAV
ncbi:MAG: hypothetical protein IPK96_18500 [Flammeovirgaceae bacterium]|nr:hypothetical protein [Flammeovirgaceae bacterium]